MNDRGGFCVPMATALYGIYVYRMYLPCDVNKMNDKKKNEFWCAIWKFALASLFMFFSVLSKSQVVFQSCMSTTFSSPPPTQPFLELRNFLPGAWGRTLQFWPRGNKVGGAWALFLPGLLIKHFLVFPPGVRTVPPDFPGVGPLARCGLLQSFLPKGRVELVDPLLRSGCLFPKLIIGIASKA